MKKSNTWLIVGFISLASISCSTLQFLNQETINGKTVEFHAIEKGQPTIVFETGMGQTVDTWNPVLDSISVLASTFIYNRPGYGASSFFGAPLNATGIAESLNETLIATGQKPPYILVGHSLGGVFINFYARLYPENVSGLIFIDSSHPYQFDYFKKDHPLLYNMLMKSASQGKRSYEASILRTLKWDYRNAPAFPSIPITVLTAGKKSAFFESDKMRAEMLAFQTDIVSLSANSKQIVVAGSGHFIHKNRPELIIQEIKNMISKIEQ